MIEQQPNIIQTLINDPAIIFRFGFIIFSLLYFVFTLIVIRQVNLMTRTVVTEGGPALRVLSFIYALLALIVVVIFVILL